MTCTVLRTFRVLLAAWMLNPLLWIPGIIVPLALEGAGVGAEGGTSLVCVEGQIACSDGTQCYLVEDQCDRMPNCADGSDEADCQLICSPDEIVCRPDSICLPSSYRCDGVDDCPDGSDEKNCTVVQEGEFECQFESEFKCFSEQKCIASLLRCNGLDNCYDGSDELDCHNHRPSDGAHINVSAGAAPGGETCQPQVEYDCKGDGSECIRSEYFCDGLAHCSEGQDETSAACRDYDRRGNTNEGNIASVANNVNECEQGNLCAHFCENFDGHHECRCKEGYHLASDAFSCLADGAEPRLIYANGSHLISYGIRSHNKTSTALNTMVQGIAYDHKAGKIFYIDFYNKAIKWISADLSGPSSTLIDQHIHDPVSLAYDWVHDILYWGDVSPHSGASYSRIEAVQLSSMLRTTVLSSPKVKDPRQIVLDPRQGEGYLYWAQIGTVPGICRSGLDGSEPNCFITTGIQQPSGLTIDYLTNTLYWIDKHLGELVSYDLLSKQRSVLTTVIEYPRHPSSLDVFEDVLYWADDVTKSVYKWKILNSGSDSPVQKVFDDLDSTKDVAVFHNQRYPSGQSYCGTNNGGCSHICLPSPHFKRHSCTCPDSTKHHSAAITYTLDSAGKQCIESVVTSNLSTVTVPTPGGSTSVSADRKTSGATKDLSHFVEGQGERSGDERTEEKSGGNLMIYVGAGVGALVIVAAVAIVIWRIRVKQSTVRRQSANQAFETKPLQTPTTNGHAHDAHV